MYIVLLASSTTTTTSNIMIGNKQETHLRTKRELGQLLTYENIRISLLQPSLISIGIYHGDSKDWCLQLYSGDILELAIANTV